MTFNSFIALTYPPFKFVNIFFNGANNKIKGKKKSYQNLIKFFFRNILLQIEKGRNIYFIFFIIYKCEGDKIGRILWEIVIYNIKKTCGHIRFSNTGRGYYLIYIINVLSI